MSEKKAFGIIGGKGVYPKLFIDAARQFSPDEQLVFAAFHGETDEAVAASADITAWMRVGQLGKLLKFFRNNNVDRCIMVGQISPNNLFDMIPDVRLVRMLAKIKEKNADTLFKGIVDELGKEGVEVVSAITYLENSLSMEGECLGPAVKERYIDDVHYGMRIARETSHLDIGQTVIVKGGTVLAVEAFEGTNDCLKRGGEQGKGKHCVMTKVAKKNHDFRFDVPCIGVDTIKNCKAAGIAVIACDAGRTMLLDKAAVAAECKKQKVSLLGVKYEV